VTGATTQPVIRMSAVVYASLWQDFDTDPELKAAVRELLEEMVNNSGLLPAEHKAASSVLCVLVKDAEVALKTKVNLEILLAPPEVVSTYISFAIRRSFDIRH